MEGKKHKSFSALSDTMGKVSVSAAAAVTPTMAATTSSHRKCKDRVQDGLKSVEAGWEDIYF